MAGETVITVVGNLTADPELNHTPNGHTVANFTIASTPRTFDRQTSSWRDGEALFLRCSVWREFAENVANSLSKGMRVVAQGRLTQRSYQDRDGNKRTAYELEVDEIGPSLRFATAQVTRGESRGQGGFGGGQPAAQGDWGRPAVSAGNNWGEPTTGSGANQGGGGRSAGPGADNPWASPAGAGGAPQGGGFEPDFGDEQPF